uniref:BRO-C n=1 Tax=Lymantria dispar multicapsid nuclear polyhedrosis virus TaxID=10449 RepID=A0A140HQU4_NPVLD|nr:BRO-C [Lymantria dispar multiple nucleopolyhedrovirus]QDE14927.1 bro-c [Lymantria dispar multiple nucleopolyhedrovirus]
MALQRFKFNFAENDDGLVSLVNRKFNFGDIDADIWITQIKTDKFLYAGHGIAEVLGYKQPKDAIRAHVKPQWKTTWEEINGAINRRPLATSSIHSQTPPNWQPNTVFISEAGVYALIMRSKLPAAEEFQRWLFEEVLPELRKTGKYSMQQASCDADGVVNYEKRFADAQMESLQLKLKLSEANTAIAKYDTTISEMKRNYEHQMAEYKEREHKMQLQMKDMQLAMQRLSAVANMTMTQFAVNALLAKDNIAENEKMRGTLAEVSGRVVPALADRPDKEEYLTGYERTTNGKRKIRMCRSQLNEIQQQDKAAKRYRDEASRPATRSGPPPSIPKRYAWLKDSEKFLQLKCPNPVAVWLKVRMEQPHMFYGLRYTNKLKTEVEVLDERELREKYAKDAAMCERNKQIHSKRIDEFRALGLLSADDCVARCLTPGLEAKERIHAVAEDILNKLDADLAPSEPMKTHCNAGDVYTTEQLVKTMTNCQNYFVKNVFNFGTYNEAPREGGAPAIEQGVKSN